MNITISEVKPSVAVFDFDGTITTKDTFLPFLIRVFGFFSVGIALIFLFIPALAVAIRLLTRDRFKALLIKKLFIGYPFDELQRFGYQHTFGIRSLYRPLALERIKWHKEQGHRLIMVSASLSFYLEPIALELGFDDLLCTRLSFDDDICTGDLSGENCRAAAKVRSLEALLGPLSQFELYAYGDSDGDAEMLAVANHPVFKPFRSERL